MNGRAQFRQGAREFHGSALRNDRLGLSYQRRSGVSVLQQLQPAHGTAQVVIAGVSKRDLFAINGFPRLVQLMRQRRRVGGRGVK